MTLPSPSADRHLFFAQRMFACYCAVMGVWSLAYFPGFGIASLALSILIWSVPRARIAGLLAMAATLIATSWLNPYSVTVDQFYLMHLSVALAYAEYLKARGMSWAFLRSRIWILLGVGYAVSAIFKSLDPVWTQGEAFHSILNVLPLPYESSPLYSLLRRMAVSFPDSVLQIAAYSVIPIQLSFLPALVARRLKIWAWLAISLLQFLGMLFLSIPDICLGMLVVHFFCYPNVEESVHN